MAHGWAASGSVRAGMLDGIPWLAVRQPHPGGGLSVQSPVGARPDDNGAPDEDQPVAPQSASGSIPPALVVALGAVPGAWIRYALVRGGARWLSQRHWATWMVNMLACLLLGLLVGLQPRWSGATGATLELALAIGFLGGLSTFSTLLAELVTLWRSRGPTPALRLGTASVVGGLLACLLGLRLARGWP